jgi:hypothetical protein
MIPVIVIIWSWRTLITAELRGRSIDIPIVAEEDVIEREFIVKLSRGHSV